MPQFRPLANVIRSLVWVDDERMINILANSIIPYGREAMQQTFTPQFYAAVFQQGHQLTEPVINMETLQILVDCQLWRHHQHIIDFILQHYRNFTEQEQQGFGSEEFWSFVSEHGQQFGAGAEAFYQIGEEGRIRVRRFNSGIFNFSIEFKSLVYLFIIFISM